jgi:hypothetical protein
MQGQQQQQQQLVDGKGARQDSAQAYKQYRSRA